MCKRKEMSTRLAYNGTDICKAEVPDDDSSRVDFRQVSDQVTASVSSRTWRLEMPSALFTT